MERLSFEGPFAPFSSLIQQFAKTGVGLVLFKPGLFEIYLAARKDNVQHVRRLSEVFPEVIVRAIHEHFERNMIPTLKDSGELCPLLVSFRLILLYLIALVRGCDPHTTIW